MARRPVQVNVKALDASVVARLRAPGETPAGAGQGEVPRTVVADPEGHGFRVLAAS